MTTAEAMAVAVLKGDMVAARALADHLCETAWRGAVELPPVRSIVADTERLRVIVYPKDGVQMLAETELVRFREQTKRWIDGEYNRIVVPFGIDRIELYEFPAKEKK